MPSLLDLFSGGGGWFGQNARRQGPTPLFPEDGAATAPKQSLFPTQSDPSPIAGPLKKGWSGITDWLSGPVGGEAGGADGLLAYKPTSRGQAISQMLIGAGQGILAQRGPYANPIGGGLLGAAQGMEQTRAHDLELRKLAQDQQYKSAAASLAKVRAATAMKQAEHAGEYTIGRTRFDPAGKPIVTAPPEEMSEYQKGELDVRRNELEHKGDITPYQQQELELRKTDLARRNDLTPYQQQELELRKTELGQKRADAANALEVGKSATERDRTRMVAISEDLRNGRDVKPEDRAWFERAYREAAQPKSTFDPATGQTTTVSPDIGDLARPPSMAASPAPAPGAATTPTQFPRAQIEDAGKATAAYQDFDTQAGEVQEMLKGMSPGERLTSDKAARIQAKLTAMIADIAARGNSGVVSPTEAANYEKRFGDLTGPGAAAKLMLGIDRAQAALDEGRKIMRSAAQAKALPVGSAAEAKTIPKGTAFMLNGHHLISLGDGKARMLDED